MRDGFDTFRFEPDKHRQYLFGVPERRQRDFLLGEIEQSTYSTDGQKAVLFGDYGRGKTHICHNLEYVITKRGLAVLPIYVKCPAFKSKEPFATLFGQMLLGHPSTEIQRVANAYATRVQKGDSKPLEQVIRSEGIARVMAVGLAAPNLDAVINSIRWLSGEPKISMAISPALKPQLTDSKDFGEVMRGLAHMFIEIDGKTPLYLVDEAERLESVTNPDVYASWLASLREISEIINVGIVFFIGANSRNNLPALLLNDEIQRRIGVSNYFEFLSASRDQLRTFVDELLRTAIRKGPVPEPQKDVVSPTALDEAVPAGLIEIVGDDPAKLAAYPFDPDAYDEFVDQVVGGPYASKPSEVLIRLQKAAQRAIRLDKQTIDLDIVEAIGTEGF